MESDTWWCLKCYFIKFILFKMHPEKYTFSTSFNRRLRDAINMISISICAYLTCWHIKSCHVFPGRRIWYEYMHINVHIWYVWCIFLEVNFLEISKNWNWSSKVYILCELLHVPHILHARPVCVHHCFLSSFRSRKCWIRN